LTKTITFPYTRFPARPSPAFPNRTFVDRPALATTIEYQGRLFPSRFFSIIDSGADKGVPKYQTYIKTLLHDALVKEAEED